MFKKITSLVLGLVVLLAVVLNISVDTKADNGYYVAVDINPSIEFLVDADDLVTSYTYLNDDAAVICEGLDFVGMNIDDAVALFVETATAAGYVDPDGDDNAVLITLIGDEEDEEACEHIKGRLAKGIKDIFAREYIDGVVLTEEFTEEALVAEAEALDVSAGKLKLAYSLIAVDETLVLEELLDTPVRDLFSMFKDLHADALSLYTESRVAELEVILAEIEVLIAEYDVANPEATEEEREAYIDSVKEQYGINSVRRYEKAVDMYYAKETIEEVRALIDTFKEENPDATDEELAEYINQLKEEYDLVGKFKEARDSLKGISRFEDGFKDFKDRFDQRRRDHDDVTEEETTEEETTTTEESAV